MTRIFKNIRQKLATENKVAAYLRYAIGEIVLVVIGILIALQVNNWNEQRKSNEKFNAVLDQIYTIVDQDVQVMSNYQSSLIQQSNIIDSLIDHPEKIDPTLLPYLLYYVDLTPDEFTSQATRQMDLLEFNPKNYAQSRLYKSIASYVYDNLFNLKKSSKYLTPLLKQYNLPVPALILGYSPTNALNLGYSPANYFSNSDRNFFTKEQQQKAVELVQQVPFKIALQSTRSQIQLAIMLAQNKKNAAFSILHLIKQYYPQARLLYQDIGIIGDAMPNKNWDENVPMTLIDKQRSIWEVKIKLSDGSVKFREGNSWLVNWGGDTFPIGNTKWFGSDIPVKKGYYKVTLNLTEKTYQFELTKE